MAEKTYLAALITAIAIIGTVAGSFVYYAFIDYTQGQRNTRLKCQVFPMQLISQ